MAVFKASRRYVDTEPKEPVNGLASHVQGRDACGRQDDWFLFSVRPKVFEQRRFSRSCLAGDEQVALT